MTADREPSSAPVKKAAGRGPGPRLFSGSFLIFLVLTIALGILCYVQLGAAALWEATVDGGDLFFFIVPRFVAALLIAGFFLALVPREFVARWIGEEAGFRGILMATLAGIATPGGPLMAWPIVVVLFKAGAGKGPIVAYITAWSMLGLQRTIVWELPLMGMEFVAIKTLSGILMPLLAGLIASRIPIVPRSGEMRD